MLAKVLSLLLLVAPCAATAASRAGSDPRWPVAARDDALLRDTSLRLHNAARRAFGVAPMVWNDQLADAAEAYARRMAATGVFDHDHTPGRRKAMGENLWSGARGVFAYDVMVRMMVDESRLFRSGVFPAVSSTGHWHDVAHYTQIVWPTTSEFGCGLASSATMDYFVCRYAPTGNKDGTLLEPGLRIAERAH